MSGLCVRVVLRANGTEQFGRWTVIGNAEPRKQHSTARVRCVCGTERVVLQQNLLNGQSKSCGCLHKEIQAVRLGKQSFIHGRTHCGAWNSWVAIRARCTNPKHKDFKHYGGRGIKVCERWATFETFLVDMGERPDGMNAVRKDKDGHYEPGNCRWAPHREQCQNSRPRSTPMLRSIDGRFSSPPMRTPT
jgi:hypothetical protein